MFSTIVVGTDGSPTARAAVLQAELAKASNANLHVVSAYASPTVAKRLLGSVPNKVAHSAPCSVMIVQTT